MPYIFIKTYEGDALVMRLPKGKFERIGKYIRESLLRYTYDEISSDEMQRALQEMIEFLKETKAQNDVKEAIIALVDIELMEDKFMRFEILL